MTMLMYDVNPPCNGREFRNNINEINHTAVYYIGTAPLNGAHKYVHHYNNFITSMNANISW